MILTGTSEVVGYVKFYILSQDLHQTNFDRSTEKCKFD